MFKPIRLDDSIAVVSVRDPAIDWDAMVAAEKAKEGNQTKPYNDIKLALIEDYGNAAINDPTAALAKIVVKSGQSLTKFIVGVIPGDEMTRISDECRGHFQALCWRSFLHSLRGIEGSADKPNTVTVCGVQYVDPEWIKKTFIRGLRSWAIEIGMAAWSWNQLTGDEIKN
jgi:hypothetical protein